MLSYKFDKVHIESYSFLRPPNEVTSASIEDKMSELYDKLNVPFGTLEKLSGIKTRYLFTEDDPPSKLGSIAAENALEQISFDRSEIKSVLNCSVTRDYFEPATAVLIHNNLNLPEDSLVMDITNACVGFSNGIITLANLIESGVLKAGIIVSAENLVPIMNATFDKIDQNKDKITREDLLELMPTFTLGSGAVAMVLCHESLASKSHKVIGSVVRAGSQHHELCVGNGDFCFCQMDQLDPLMSTQSQKLIAAATRLGARTLEDFKNFLGWSLDEVDHIICHQIGRQVNSLYSSLGFDFDKCREVYEKYGNLVSAAMPSSLISHAEDGTFKENDQICLTAYGSGLNSVFTGIRW